VAIRCGGWVDRGDGRGWVLDVPSLAAEPPPAPALPAPNTQEPQRPSEPARATCPDCEREFTVNKDGTLRKHTCVIDAPPQVTFNGGE